MHNWKNIFASQPRPVMTTHPRGGCELVGDSPAIFLKRKYLEDLLCYCSVGSFGSGWENRRTHRCYSTSHTPGVQL